MNPIESFSYAVYLFVDTKMIFRSTTMRFLQNRVHFISGKYQLHDHISVSYTHLDVYKRQVQRWQTFLFTMEAVRIEENEPQYNGDKPF